MLVADIYNTKVFPIHEDMTVEEAMQILLDKSYNGVIVLNKEEKLVGIFSLQDIAAATVPQEMQENTQLSEAMYQPNFFKDMCTQIKKKKVKDVMRTNYITATIETSIMTVAADFLKNDLYLVPIVEEEKVIGVITRSEIKKALAIGMGLFDK